MQETHFFYAIKPPISPVIKRVKYSILQSIDCSEEKAWKKFLNGENRIKAYKLDGFKAVRVKLTVEYDE